MGKDDDFSSIITIYLIFISFFHNKYILIYHFDIKQGLNHENE